MNKVTTFAIAVASVCASGLATAQDFSCGKLTTAHLNPAIAGRGYCTIMVGAAPNGDPWFCNVSADNPLYEAINNLIQQAALEQTGRNCLIASTFVGGETHNLIEWIQCGTPGC
jgi:hypothetical protein